MAGLSVEWEQIKILVYDVRHKGMINLRYFFMILDLPNNSMDGVSLNHDIGTSGDFKHFFVQ